uniref:PNPLA domain-containing protein n=1 Tax=viral metagenome TaxID=1070528 RepID=A0A6C0EQW8_9ZZZZ
MTIKHLVISGGGPTMVQSLGSIQHLEQEKFILRDKIESIYGTSAGAIVGTLICLNFDWETINDYIIKRPWQDVFSIKVQDIFDSYTKKGIFDTKTIEKCFKPLLNAKDISLQITLKEFYDYSKIEMHFFTFEINKFSLIDISYLTHPELELLTAIQMTCGIPVLLTPVCIEDKCYIDGGMVCNYPLKYCVDSGKNVEEILGIKNQYNNSNTNCVDSSSNMLDFIMCILFNTIFSLKMNYIEPIIKYEVINDTELMSFESLKNALSSIEVRTDLLNSGIQTAKGFLSKQNISNNL